MEKNNPKISVIVPVYNVEQYLPRCIDSILAQTFTDYELLLIDDGSPDNSGRICDEYAKKDKRIRVFHKENGGVSSARNLGLDNVKGEWIAFIDGDDCISKDFLSLGMTDGIDVIQKPYLIKDINGKENFHKVNDVRINKKEKLYKFYVQKRDNALWNKIISSNLIKDKRFDENVSIGEDFLFFLSLLSSISSYKFNNKGMYIYYKRENSAMQSIDIPHRITVLFQNIKNVRDITEQQNIADVGNSIIYSTYINYLWSLRKFLNSNQKQAFKRILKQLAFKELKYISFYHKVLFFFRKRVLLFFC